jgi:hypothetical protein
LVLLVQRVVALVASSQTAGAFYRGMRLMALDALVMDVADMPETPAPWSASSSTPSPIPVAPGSVKSIGS